MPFSEAEVEEIYERMKEREESKQDTANKMPQQPKMWFAILLAAVIFATIMKWIAFKTGMLLAIAIVIIIRYIFGSAAMNREYNEQECAIALYKKLRYKQIHALGEFYQIAPHVKIQVEKIGRRVVVNGVPHDRIFGVSLFDPRSMIKEWYKYIIDVRTLDLRACKKLPAGFIDLEDWDIRTIESQDLRDMKRYWRATGTNPPRGTP